MDVDDVPWREELTTAVPHIEDGVLTIPENVGVRVVLKVVEGPISGGQVHAFSPWVYRPLGSLF